MPFPMPNVKLSMRSSALLSLLLPSVAVAQAAPGQPTPPTPATANPYQLQPFHAEFPAALEYPPRHGGEYDRSRRQILRRLAANLAGNVRREAWQLATEFYWRAPEDAVEPLIEAMDAAFGNAAAGDADVVRNCVEAMGKMGRVEFEPALKRALQHKNPAVVQSVMAALSTCAVPATLSGLAASFESMDSRTRDAWLRAVRLRLGADGVPLLQQVMMGPYHASVRDQALRETLQLPMPAAASVLRGRFHEADGKFKAIIAGVLHAAGDAAGTTWLQEALQSEDLEVLADAIKHCGYGELGVLREPLLRASTHQRPEIRAAVAQALSRIDGDDVADVFETLLGPDEPWEVRGVALRELTRRGRTKAADLLLEEVATMTSSTRLQGLLSQLSACGDPRGAPILLDRFRKAPAGEGRPFLQALAQNQSEAAARGLCALWQEPDRVIGHGGGGVYTTRTYIPTMLLNLRGQERVVLETFLKLPKEEWSLRALLMPTIVGLAADRKDPKLQAELIAPVRALLFDRTELPQLRVQALNLLTRSWLTIDDVLQLKKARAEETPQLRALFGDFLHDFF
ncbi:MAG: HEAT repeat domain-containing protein [Planctomycetes bacterium]|jgi:HEAT repeat protein|nr:HEAT repeat domain-containing protein [Planctomycetota bacterium]